MKKKTRGGQTKKTAWILNEPQLHRNHCKGETGREKSFFLDQ